MEIVARGAEAVLYRKNGLLIKQRIPKKYSIKQIDEKLRKSRTTVEASLLSNARRVGVPTPKIVEVDKNNAKITMEFIIGIKLKDLLNTIPTTKIAKICYEVGRSIGKLHKSGIIHGDLTTSNMIYHQDKVYFIDFGLGFFSKKIEDQGVDLKLLKDALKSTHFKVLNVCWRNIVKGYKHEYSKAELVIKKVDEIEKRARYKER